MSLEAEMSKLTAALEANTAALTGGGGAPAKKPAADAKKSPAKKPAAKKGITADDIASSFGEYLKTGDKDERAEAKANVKAIIDNMDTDRITNLDPDRYQEALDFLAQFRNGENPFEDEGDDGDDLM